MAGTTVRRYCGAGYDEGTLKALLDGELSHEHQTEINEHVQGCAACAERVSRLRLDGALVHGRLQLLDAAAVPSRLERAPVAAVLAAAQSAPRGPAAGLLAWRAQWREVLAPVWRPWPVAVGAAAAAVLFAGAALTQPAVQSFAQGALQPFRVQKVQPVRIDVATLPALPVGVNLDDLLASVGTYSGPKAPTVRLAAPADASKRDAPGGPSRPLRGPTKLPSGVKNERAIFVSDPLTFTFTYDGQKLVQVAQEMGVTEPALLAQLRGLDRVTAKGNVPAAAAVVYGDLSERAAAHPTIPAGSLDPTAKRAAAQAPKMGQAGKTDPAAAAASHTDGQKSPADEKNTSPFLVFVELKSPSVELPSDVNVDQLRAQLLRSGVLPPALATQLAGIADWHTTLPIPLVNGTARDVPVDGTTATLITGEAPWPVIVWQRDGFLSVLAGTGTEQELLEAARSLAPAK